MKTDLVIPDIFTADDFMPKFYLKMMHEQVRSDAIKAADCANARFREIAKKWEVVE